MPHIVQALIHISTHPVDSTSRFIKHAKDVSDNYLQDSYHRGLLCTFVSTLFFALMGVCIYAAHLESPKTNSLLSSFIRVLVNLLIILIPAFVLGRVKSLFGDLRPSLFLRGFFGGVALMLSFAAIKAIGIGESSFLGSSNAVFIALLAPIILKEKNSIKGWIAILGSIVGLYLLFNPRMDDFFSYGRILAVLSGFFAALACIMIARSGKSNPTVTVIFYFCFVGVLLHLVAMPFIELDLPTTFLPWLYLSLSGVFAHGGQIFLTKGYQLAPAHLNAAVGYSGPVINLILSIFLFNMRPDFEALVGCAIVLVCGVCLPFCQFKTR